MGRFPIWVKVSAFDENRNRKELDEIIKGCQVLQESGCDAIEVSCGYGFRDKGFNTVRVPKTPVDAILAALPDFRNYSPLRKRIFKIALPLIIKKYKPLYNYNVSSAEIIKKNLDIPVIVVGGIRKLIDIENIVETEGIDFVSMCRPFIIEPNIINKFQEGKATKSKCIDCGYCLLGVASRNVKCYFGRLDASKERFRLVDQTV